jgi:hypothetical protein
MNSKMIVILIMTLMIAITIPFSSALSEVQKNGNEQQLNDRWVKHFEGTSWAHVIRQAEDGYVLVGATDVDISGDGLVMKVDFSGNEIWKKTFPNSAFEGLCITTNNSYVISGWKIQYPKISGYLLELNDTGDVKWQGTYEVSDSCQLIQVTQTCDGGFAASGFYVIPSGTDTDAWLIKTDENGMELWNKTFGFENSSETFHSIHETSDCGFILPGWISILPDQGLKKMGADGWVVKTDPEGNKEWEQVYDTGNNIMGIDKVDNINMGRQDLDGGYVFTGWSSARILLDKGALWIFKTDENGNKIWEKNYGRLWFHDLGLWVEPTTDGGYIAAGKRNGIGTLLNIIQKGIYMPIWNKLWVIKTDSEGISLWDITYKDATARCVQETSDGGFIIAGHRGSYYGTKGILLIKTDENGRYKSTWTINPPLI